MDSTGVGGMLVGIAAVLSAVVAAWQATRARGHARDAADTAGIPQMETMRAEIDRMVAAYRRASERMDAERAGYERDIARQRARADEAEALSITLHAELAGLKIDLASARAEVSELRTRFEQSLGRN